MFTTTTARHSRTRPSPRQVTYRPRLEALEDRTVPSAGMLDPTFGQGGLVTTNFGTFYPGDPFGSADSIDGNHSMAVQPDGKIVAAGSTQNASTVVDFAVARYNADGSLDPSFGTGGLATVSLSSSQDSCLGMALQPDGKIVMAGWTYQGGTRGFDFGVVRLNSNGSLDTTFGTGGLVIIDFGSTADFCDDVALQADGSIVVAGSSFQANTGWDFAVARLNSNGGLDATFGTGGRATIDFGGSEECYSMALQPDGRIILAGRSDSNNFAVARLNGDGSPDTSFGTGGLVTGNYGLSYGEWDSVALQADGKVVLSGYTVENGPTGWDFAVGRLNSDGSPDTSFGTAGLETIDFGSTNDLGASIAIQADAKIVVAGYAEQASSAADFAVARLNSDGSPDASFGTDGLMTIGFGEGYDYGSSVALQADGSIVVGGTSYQADTGWDFTVARLQGGAMDVTTPAAVAMQLNELITTANLSGQPSQLAFQVTSVSDASTVVQAINDISSGGATFNGTLTLNMAPITYGGLTVQVPNGMTLIIGTSSFNGGQQATIDPAGPAFTVVSGNVIVSNVTFVTTGNAPTILVTGGTLTLHNDLVQESPGYNDAAIQITGGSLNLVGGNTLDINGAGQFFVSTGSSIVTAVDNTYQVNGVTLAVNGMDELIQLLAQAAALNLNTGQSNSLTSTLQAAEQSLLRANTTSAVNQLGAFINEVNALLNSHRLGEITADSLIDGVEDLLGNLS